eukprot:5610672-Lingulodinium_polyedra.AAC.1
MCIRDSSTPTPENWHACGMRICDLRTTAAADGRFDRIVVQRLQNATRRCGQIGRSPPQRLTNRTRAHSTRAPDNWRAQWNTRTCDLRAAAAADGQCNRAPFCKRCTMRRSNRPSAAATAR